MNDPFNTEVRAPLTNREQLEQALFDQIQQRLTDSSAVTLEYDNTSDRTGYETIALVKNAKSTFFASICRHDQGGFNTPFGQQRDYISIEWADVDKNESGALFFYKDKNYRHPFSVKIQIQGFQTVEEIMQKNLELHYHPDSLASTGNRQLKVTDQDLLDLGVKMVQSFPLDQESRNKSIQQLKNMFPAKAVTLIEAKPQQ